MENKENLDVAILVIVASLGILLLVFFVIFIVLLYQKRMLASKTLLVNQQKEHSEELLRASLEIAEAERRKLAKDVHDDVGILLNVLKINISRVEKNLNNPAEIAEIVSGSKELAEKAIASVRHIYDNIMPKSIFALGLVKSIAQICQQINESEGAEVHYHPRVEQADLEENTAVQLFRLIKEVLNNTLKHAKPAFIEIVLEKDETRLILNILHNGMGISTTEIKELSKQSKGLGLKSILTRAELLKAELEFSAVPDGRALVSLSMNIA